MLIVLHMFQCQGNGYWKSVRARDGWYLIGRRELFRQRAIDSSLWSQRMGSTQL